MSQPSASGIMPPLMPLTQLNGRMGHYQTPRTPGTRHRLSRLFASLTLRVRLSVAPRALLLGSCLALVGCGTIFPNSTTYIPVTIRVDDQAQYAKDLAECHAVADGYSPGFNTGTVAQATFSGAASNAAYGVINPLVPAAGAAGGAATSIMAGVGITGQDSITILAKCASEETRRDHSAIVADPHG